MELFEEEEERDASTTDSKHLEFYHYQGSLTMLPCSENVNWFVHKRVLPISKEHLEQFQIYCCDSHGNLNYREVMPLNDRRVIKNFK